MRLEAVAESISPRMRQSKRAGAVLVLVTPKCFLVLEQAKLMRDQGAGTICFQQKYWASESFPRGLMRDCKSQREGLLLHSKMIYVRLDNPNVHGNMAWAYLGSHNLSESAW
jgi:hypothetical protein